MTQDEILPLIVLLSIVGLIVFTFHEAYKQGYKKGQVDERKGVVKKPYVLIEFRDGERKWMRENEIKQYSKSYTEGYKIINEQSKQ